MNPNWQIPVPGAGRPDHFVVFDDFMNTSLSATADAAAWLTTIPGTADAVATLDTVVGGAILLTSASDAEMCIDPNGGGFNLPSAPGKPVYFEARLKLASVSIANGQLFVGLGAIADVTPIAGDTSKIGISRKTADASLWWTVGDTLTDSTLDATADTFFTVAVRYANGTATFFIDLEQGAGPQLIGRSLANTLPAATTLLSPKVALGLSAANAQTCTVDYILAIQAR